MKIKEQEDEVTQYLEDCDVLVRDDGAEEIIDFNPYEQISEAPTQTLMSATKTYSYSIATLMLIANAHLKTISKDKSLILKVLTALNTNNGVCEGIPNRGLDYMCPCKQFREIGNCHQKLFY